MKKKWAFLTIFFVITISILLLQNRKKENITLEPPKKIVWEQSYLMERLDALSDEKLKQMHKAGKEIAYWEGILRKGNTHVVKEILADTSIFYTFQHYPKGDVIDLDNLSQYYYHAHRAEEHGHFHTFVLQDLPEKRPSFSHLIAISMSSTGKPIRLFTVNQWVCNDRWQQAKDLIDTIDHFKIELPHPSWPINRWISSMITLFYPQIVTLLQERDLQIEGKETLKQKEKEVLTEMSISTEKQIKAIEKVLEKRSLI